MEASRGETVGSVDKLIKYPAYINASPGLAWLGSAWLDSLGRVSIMQMLVGKCNLNSKTNSKQEHDRMSSRWLLLLLARNNSVPQPALSCLPHFSLWEQKKNNRSVSYSPRSVCRSLAVSLGILPPSFVCSTTNHTDTSTHARRHTRSHTHLHRQLDSWFMNNLTLIGA